MKQKAITISLIKNNSIEDNAGEQRMTSMEIAQLTGKQHKNVMQAIRNMEPAWEKTAGLKFQLGSYEDANGQMRPCYSLTKTECLYIATKFNDEARARLIMRWQELEMDQREALEWEHWKARWSQIERPKGAIALLGCSEEDILDEADDIIGEELDELGLSVPAVNRVFSRVRAAGVDLDPAVYTVDQAKAAILEALARKGGR